MNQIFFYIASGILIVYLFFFHKEDTPSFVYQAKMQSSEIPVFIKNDLPKIAKAPSVHSASITELSDRRIFTVWFAGSGEGKSDVKIYGSFYDASKNLWTEPRVVLTRQKLKMDSKHFIKKLGNPVIYKSANGDLHLFVVGVTFGGWATSKIYHYISKDGAISFSYAGVLRLGALMNLSHLVRSSPVGLGDGGFYLPVYHELADKYPLIVRFDAKGEMLDARKITDKKGQLQPSIVPLNEKECLAVMRNYYDKAMNMQFCKSGGLVWEAPVESNLINENNSIAIFKINDEIFLIHNTREKSPEESRGTLVLSMLKEKEWKQIAILDIARGIRKEGKSVEVSYPNVKVGQQFVDIVYTNNRSQISHIRFNQKWLEEKIREKQ